MALVFDRCGCDCHFDYHKPGECSDNGSVRHPGRGVLHRRHHRLCCGSVQPRSLMVSPSVWNWHGLHGTWIGAFTNGASANRLVLSPRVLNVFIAVFAWVRAQAPWNPYFPGQWDLVAGHVCWVCCSRSGSAHMFQQMCCKRKKRGRPPEQWCGPYALYESRSTFPCRSCRGIGSKTACCGTMHPLQP